MAHWHVSPSVSEAYPPLRATPLQGQRKDQKIRIVPIRPVLFGDPRRRLRIPWAPGKSRIMTCRARGSDAHVAAGCPQGQGSGNKTRSIIFLFRWGSSNNWRLANRRMMDMHGLVDDAEEATVGAIRRTALNKSEAPETANGYLPWLLGTILGSLLNARSILSDHRE